MEAAANSPSAPPLSPRTKFIITLFFLALQFCLGLIFVIVGFFIPRCHGWKSDNEYYELSCGRTKCCVSSCSDDQCIDIPALHILDIVGIAVMLLASVMAVSVIWHYKVHFLPPKEVGAKVQPDEETKASLPV